MKSSEQFLLLKNIELKYMRILLLYMFMKWILQIQQ